MQDPTPVLVTGGAGYLGSLLVQRLARRRDIAVVVTDLKPASKVDLPDGVTYYPLDVRDPALADLLAERQIEVVIHLAAIVAPGHNRQLEYEVDVGGSRNVLDACLRGNAGSHGVRRLITTSSGAAYGYQADHPRWLTEDHALRAEETFSYAWHKRLVEEMLAEAREQHPELEQVVFRPCTILGPRVDNGISRLLLRRRIPGVRGGDDRFVLIWDQDAARALEFAIHCPATGVFNLAADGALSLGEMAQRMGKAYLRLPPWLLAAGLAIGRPLGLTEYGPEQVRFLRYRPVLGNQKLKDELGFVPEKSTEQVFELFLRERVAAEGQT